MTTLLAAYLVFCPPRPPEDWKLFKPAGERFQISFPGKPETQTEKLTLPSGEMTLIRYSVKSGDKLYLVQDSDMSPGVHAEVMTGPEATLNSVVISMGEAMGGKKISSEPTKIQGYLGRDFLYERKEKRVKGFTILAKNHNYCVIFMGMPGAIDGADCKRFLDSFKVLKE